MGKEDKSFHTGAVKKSTTIDAPVERVWRKISDIAGLPTWVKDVKRTVYLSKKRKGVGAIRKITFEDDSTIEEHVVAWKQGEYFTYVATEGLPLRAYIATISMESKPGKVQITWKSYVNSKKMTKKQFADFLGFMGLFYEESLANLKLALEKKTAKA